MLDSNAIANAATGAAQNALPENAGENQLSQLIEQFGRSDAVSYTHLTLPTTPYV